MHSIDTGGLENIKTFDQLLPWLRDNLKWPIDDLEFDHEPFDNLTFEYDAARDLGLKQEDIAHIREIRQLRPLVTNQPWGIFFINFEDKKIPVGVLKRLLGGLTLKKRHSANKAEQKGWNLHDLLFISAHGKSGERELSFLHFTEDNGGKQKIILKELGWDQQDTKSKLDYVANTLKLHLSWPETSTEASIWREQWASAFTSKHGAAISTAKDLTKRLAELASAIRKSVNEVLAFENKTGSLTKIFDQFKKILFHNLTHADFADMYAQTICYGLLAVQIDRTERGLDIASLTADDAASHAQQVIQPFLKDLMETFLAVGGRKREIDFNELGIDEVVEALQQADMKAVLRDFGNRNQGEDPILYFYVYFLRDYDSIMQKQRGVYYTPLPVVRYIVRSVDEILQKEFGLVDGLADTVTWGEMRDKNPSVTIPNETSQDDPFVQILDPAIGTGTFLVEVIGLVEERMKSKWQQLGKNKAEIEILWNDYVPTHLLPRLHGFELMMAPYAIAHIKIGMKLNQTGYRPKDPKSPRVRVYLTNTLEEVTGASDQYEMSFISESLALETRGANNIKSKTPITVIIGNPPYSISSSNKGDWIKNLIYKYKKNLNEKKINLDDDFIKFISMSQWKLENTGQGIFAMITSNTFIDGITHRQMRGSLMDTFNKIHIYNLHGNSRKGEVCPDGSKDENVFDIQQGVSINLFIKSSKILNTGIVKYSDLWGLRQIKLSRLSKESFNQTNWLDVNVREFNYLFRKTNWGKKFGSDLNYFVQKEAKMMLEYGYFWDITDIFPAYNSGVISRNDEITMHFSEDELGHIIHDFVNLSVGELRAKYHIRDGANWKLADAKRDVMEGKDVNKVCRITYRPFDNRYTLFTRKSGGFLNRPVYDVMKHLANNDNLAIITTRQQPLIGFRHIYCSNTIVDIHSTSDQSYVFPMYLYLNSQQSTLLEKPNRKYNLSEDFINELSKVFSLEINSVSSNTEDTFVYEGIFHYVYCILYSHIYRSRYAEQIQIDFPHIPLPGSRDLLLRLVELGRILVALHVLDEKVATVLTIPETRYVGRGDALIERRYPKYSNGKVMISAVSHFEDVTPEVWNFRVGSYQVCEKWLKDRAATGGKNPSPGRILTEDDILHYRRITIAIRETIKLMQQIDEVINAHGGWPEAFAHS